MTIGYHASHEQFPPATLLGLALRAGIRGPDVLRPFPPVDGCARAVGPQLGVGRRAGGAERVDPGHGDLPDAAPAPALVAQAAATLEQLAPGRIWLALGTGEALNERITGQPWPAKRERQKALRAAAEVMRRLWGRAGRPQRWLPGAPGATVQPTGPSPAAAGCSRHRNRTLDGGWADGLITISQPLAQLRRVVAAFEQGGGRGQADVPAGQAPTRVPNRRHWKARWSSGAPMCCHRNWPKAWTSPSSSRHRPGRSVPSCASTMHVSADLGQHRAWLQELQSLGFDRIYLHNVNREQDRFIDDFAEHVLPALRSGALGGQPRVAVALQGSGYPAWWCRGPPAYAAGRAVAPLPQPGCRRS